AALTGEKARFYRADRRRYPADRRAPESIAGRVYSKALNMTDFRQDFLAFALARDVLRFGDFVTKAGRKSPYFFNAGLFNDGASLGELGRYYATAYLASDVRCDQLYGPAYK